MPTQPKGMPSILGDVAPPFSAPQPQYADFEKAFPEWQKNQTPEMNTRILSTLQPIIDTAVSSYVGPQPSPTMKSRARLMALKSLNTYDPNRGTIKTHLLSQLQSLRRLNAKSQNIISIPEQVGLDYQMLTKTENELRDQFSRAPTDEELADATGLSTRRIRKIRDFNQPISEGMTARQTDSESGPNDALASRMPGDNSAADAWLNFVYDDLTPTDKLVMDMTLGRNGRRRASTQDIARRLNISPGAVSQRAAKIQNMIDQRYLHNF